MDEAQTYLYHHGLLQVWEDSRHIYIADCYASQDKVVKIPKSRTARHVANCILKMLEEG